jgi:superfamily II DNA helicase RecQ
MLDQVAYLRSLGINAAAIYSGQDPEILDDIEEGIYSHVYVSPESMLSVERWRTMLSSPTFQQHCIAICVDEAHCISHW